ncbi:MAG: HIT family protein [candidate division Zixibacteria bacterium]|nr:HIT family protein [candidate division Zixibacteria bacterium]
MPSVFTQIIARKLPASIFYEDAEVIVIADYCPQTPVHLLIIPKQEYRTFYETPPDVLDMMNRTAKMIAEKLGITGYFKLLIHNGFGQEIDHVHFHFMSNRGAENLKFIES